MAKYWSFSFSISPYNEYSGLISFRTDWFDHLARDSQECSPTSQFESISFWHSNLWSNYHIHTWLLEVMCNFCNSMNCSLPGSSVHGIFPARILKWIAIFYSRAIFPTQGLNSCLLCLLHWQADSLPLRHLGSPCHLYTYTNLGNGNEKKESWSGKRSSLPWETKSGEAKANNFCCSWVTDRLAYSPWL